MATNTTKLALTKPDGTDLVDVAVLNNNFDKIDTASGAFICTSTTRPASPWNGQLIFETDTLNVLVYRTSTSTWSLVGGSSVGSNPPAGAGNGNFWWDSDNGKLYIYYQDGNSAQWVSVMPGQTTVEVAQNYIINGDFSINQRAFSSTTTSSAYGFDRWRANHSGGTVTYSAQTFTLGTAPVAGYEAKNFARVVTAGQSTAGHFAVFVQPIENVRTLAGQTATVSFWAKANSGTPKVAIEFDQFFGSGGSPSARITTLAGQVTLSTSWARYSITVAVPSIAGKTIGTNNDDFLGLDFWVSAGSDFNTRTGSIGIQNNTFDFWGVQVESGSVATGFRRNANSIQGELAACQRYYYRLVAGATQNIYFATSSFWANGSFFCPLVLPVEMRATPTTSISNLSHFFMLALNANTTPTTFSATGSTRQGGFYSGTISTGSAGQSGTMFISSGTNGWIEFAAEL